MNREKCLSEPAAGHHLVQVYSEFELLCDAVGLYIRSGLKQGHAAVIIARRSHTDGIRKILREKGVAVDVLHASRQMTFLNAEDTLDRFMINGQPDRKRFEEVVGDAIEQACRRWGHVFGYGEMVDVLWQGGHPEAAIHLEDLWNDLLKKHSTSLLCSYRMDRWNWENYNGPLQSICQTHSHFIPAEDHVRWDYAVDRAINEVLDPKEAAALERYLASSPSPTQMPAGAAKLLFLGTTVPRINVKVVHRAGQYYRSK